MKQKKSSPAKLAYMKKYHALNRERDNARTNKWYYENQLETLEQQKEYSKLNPEVNRKASMKYRKKMQALDPEFEKKRNRKTVEARQRNPEKWREYNRIYLRERYATDIEFNITCRLRSRLYQKLRVQGATKSASALDLTGCTTQFLRGYLEAMFRDGMNWNNIHVDHIVPLAAFDLTNEDDQRKAFHYTNLQPLFGVENMAKGAKIEA